jgi:hypothetical protein
LHNVELNPGVTNRATNMPDSVGDLRALSNADVDLSDRALC